jgi:hypothetical protein
MEENILMMRCTKCGEMNQLPVVHCKKCGARLDFETAEKHMIEAGGPTVQDQLRIYAKLAVAAVLVVIILLLLWPGKMTRATGEEIDAKRYRMKKELLLDALNRGLPASQVIAEAELNAHLREMVATQPTKKGGLSARLVDIGARFFEGRAEVFVAVGRGPLTFTGHFYAKTQGSKLVVTGAKAGHLPLPSILGKLYANTQAGLFRQMKDESRIVRNLDGVSVNNESIELLTKSLK